MLLVSLSKRKHELHALKTLPDITVIVKIYRQLTHTNTPAAASMHHAGVAVHTHYGVVGCGSSPCFHHLLAVVIVLKQPSLIIHTSRELLQQSVLDLLTTVVFI